MIGAKEHVIPAIVREGDWQVHHNPTAGTTNIRDAQLEAPLYAESCPACGQDHARHTRLHELIHARISPVSKEGRTDNELLAYELAEEARVEGVVRKYYGPDTNPICFKMMQRILDQGITTGNLTMLIGTAMAGGGPNLSSSDILGYIAQAAKLQEDPAMGQLLETLAVELYNAAYIHSGVFGDHTNTDYFQLLVSRIAEMLEKYSPAAVKSFFDGTAEAKAEGDSKTGSGKPRFGLKPERAFDGMAPHWGEARLEEPPLTRPHRRAKEVRSRRFVEQGVVPTAMYRLPIDRRVFSTRRKVEGGTILVDGSGSMHLSPEDVEAIIEAAPAATVAIYAGHISGKYGILRIIARNGYMAEPWQMSLGERYYENYIDLNALRWLATQPKPRIWVSDGLAYCLGDAELGFAQIRAFRQTHGIKQAQDPSEALLALRYGKDFPWNSERRDWTGER